MRDKERLLSEETPLRFLFSHTALKEGWDNPNVFQICTLREIGTERERRQTIGRGLRLPVNQEGERIRDNNVNKLTVIASESFEAYAKGLQEDMEKDMGDGFKFGRLQPISFAKLISDQDNKAIGQEQSRALWQALCDQAYLDKNGDITAKFNPKQDGFQFVLPDKFAHLSTAVTEVMKRHLFSERVIDARKKATVRYQKRVIENADFQALWRKIGQKTRYQVNFETQALVKKALENIAEMPRIKPLSLTIEKTAVNISEAGIEQERALYTPKEHAVITHQTLPDILSFLQRETHLTRHTLVEILKQCGRLAEFRDNPQAFMTAVAKHIKRARQALIITDIQYERIEGQYYDMRLFVQEDIEKHLDRLYQIQQETEEETKAIRTPYDYIEFDSEGEKKIAQALDHAENVRFFCKLPSWFKIATPLGSYNPDWALVTEDEGKLYLVRESKSTHDPEKRRPEENLKIKCGEAHFEALGVNFKVATVASEIASF